MKRQKLAGYLAAVVAIAALAFVLDLLTANVGVSFQTVNWLDDSGAILRTQQIKFPLWHQIAGLVKNFLYALGTVILVTVFVTNRLEKAQRDKAQHDLERRREEVERSVFDSLFKQLVPEEIFTVIKQHIIMRPTIRKKAIWVYDFQHTGKDKILLRAMNHYQIHNVGQEEVQNPVKITLNPLGGNDYRLVEAKCVASDRRRVLVTYTPEAEEGNTGVRMIRDGEKTHVEFTVSVPPGDYIEYTMIYERQYEGRVIFDAQFTKMPVVDAQLIVNFPKGYRFDVSAHFSSDLRLVSESPVQKTYVIEGAILPEQGFVFYLTAQREKQKSPSSRRAASAR